MDLQYLDIKIRAQQVPPIRCATQLDVNWGGQNEQLCINIHPPKGWDVVHLL